MLSVADTRIGMSPAVRSHLFEPFFSTKEFGTGAGLDLAAVYGIVQKSATGSISVRSSPGAGTTFKIFLPRVSEKEATPAPTLPLPLAEPLRGTETVLLVEDQAPLRSLAREILEKLGYTVLTAAHGEEAMRVAYAFPGRIDLLLTVVMPGANGVEIANRLKPLRSDMRVLYVSGNTQDAFAEPGLIGTNDEFMDKPFAPEELAQKIRKILNTA